MRWTYGDSWERYPIEPGQTWTERMTGSRLAVSDILRGLPGFMCDADMIYCDPPFGAGALNSFYHKAGIDERHTFAEFADAMEEAISSISPSICYLEIGRQNVDVYRKILADLYLVVQEWGIVYSKKSPMLLLRGGSSSQEFDFSGCDDRDAPLLAMQHEQFSCVADFCMGRGLTALSAFSEGKRFVGTDLNKRRLAVTIDRIARQGGVWICG